MNVKIIATKNCSHYQSLQHELMDIGVSPEVLFVEEHPDLVATYSIRHSPNILVDEEVVFRGQPTPLELRQLFVKG
jgi:predicted thioredoxin/glutaredoxin